MDKGVKSLNEYHSTGNLRKNTAISPLIIASLVTLSVNGAYADTLAPIPSVAEDKPEGTLDKLAGQEIPNSDPVRTYPADGSAYTLTKLQEGGEKPAGDNIITKFTYNTETKVMTPVYYQLELKQTTYGEGDTTKTFTLTSEPVTGVEITAKYNNLSDKIYDTEYKDNHYEAEVTSGGSFSNHKQEIHSALQNSEGDTISVDNAIFKDNSTVINFNTIGIESSLWYIDVLGGAIYNEGTIDAITADFINNSVTGIGIGSLYNDPYGGAIYNAAGATIGDITGDFISNYAQSEGSYAYGGAIYNAEGAAIGDITGDFISNYAQSEESYAYGGAIYNAEGAAIGDITGDFIGNYASSSSGGIVGGGAIYNASGATIGDITGDFIGNYVSSSAAVSGGVIYNVEAAIGDITGDFIGNYASSSTGIAAGGAIYNNRRATIGDITGNFIGNYVSSYVSAQGGAIYNSSTSRIGDITGDFIGNYATSTSSYGSAQGGAIYNSSTSTIDAITGDFIGNYATAASVASHGGAIYNEGTINTIKGDFIGNHADNGGAISNIGNWSSYYGSSKGSTAEISSINANFINNYATNAGGAIYNQSSVIGSVDAPPSDKLIPINSLTFKNIETGESLTLYVAQNPDGGELIKLDDIQNKITNAGYYIYVVDEGSEDLDNALWEELMSQFDEAMLAESGIFTTSPDVLFDEDAFYKETYVPGIVNSNFIGNYAKSENGTAKGGAIYTNKCLVLAAKDDYTSVISGNYVEDTNGKRPEAIYVDEKATLGFEATNNGKFVIDDTINGSDGYTVTFDGDETGAVYLNNNIESVDYASGTNGTANVKLSNITLNLGRDDVLNNNNLTLGSGTLNMVNNQVGVSSLNSLTVKGDTNFAADVDLANKTMDRFESSNYNKHKGNINVVGMNLLSDAPEGQEVTDIYFAQIGLKDNVRNGMTDAPNGYQTTAYTPIYKYHVMYDNREDGGYFKFTRGDNMFTPGGGTTNTGNPSDAFNPAILSSPVAAQAGAYAAQNAAFTYAFTHADTFMPLPSVDRFALRHANKYAITSYDNLEMQMNDLHEKGMWVRPYTSFESIPLKNGPDVDTITYGTMIGGDSDFKELKNGWGTVFTGYVGYNGSSQHYSGVDTYQNGGLIGATQTFYKGNFFTALTASVGASAGESHNMYGTDNFAMLMAGVASKSGYNIEFKDGRFIIQPSLMLSYSFINTFDYKTASGVNMDSDPMHAIQINPNVKFIANLKNGWQPYASVGMVWNLLDGTNVRANTVRLPEMSIKPYVEYGLGVQKRWKDKYTGYVQAMVRNGGRNGVALTGGFRWALGKEGKAIDKVENIEKPKTIIKLSSMRESASTSGFASASEASIMNRVQNAKVVRNDNSVTSTTSGKKIIKQLTPAQKTALGAKPQNTTRTTAIGTLKQL